MRLVSPYLFLGRTGMLLQQFNAVSLYRRIFLVAIVVVVALKCGKPIKKLKGQNRKLGVKLLPSRLSEIKFDFGQASLIKLTPSSPMMFSPISSDTNIDSDKISVI